MKINKIHTSLYWMLSFGFLLFFQQSMAQDLNAYIEQATANNADLRAYELRHHIAQEKVNESNTIPDTDFGVGYFVSTPETRVGAQRARFSVKQMLPWFGTISARSDYQKAVADASYIDYVIAKRKLGLVVAQNYYSLYAKNAQIQVLEQNIQLLETYEELALNAVSIAKASAVDVLKLQIRQNDLKARQAVLTEELAAAKIQFNAVLNTDDDTAVFIADSLVIPLNDIEVDWSKLAQNPELLKYDKLYESITQAEALNQREASPKLGIGLDYLPVSERADMNIADNGKDIVMPMLSVSVPIFNTKYKSVSKQNTLKQEELQAQRSQRLNMLKSLFAEAVKNRNTARINYDTQRRNLEQAKDAEDILLKSYETGTIDFNDVLDIQEMQLQIQLNQIQAVQNYYGQAALINYLTKL
ncbi:TolC family protein [Leeuwenhoekiella marinoflava]|uniref:Outer membrane protein TolC n=2 Tax=Leeuwenhoekiella marinoflava TaxID=988 RepID=A0A4Q0PLX4_9FLAO|nr:TolC family protein [Leeuwenhoekiella marinoflava]RXG30727.1 outer membrane protein TolC [Leeuwenhoekiella marinoflava]SHF18438.1 Outer membrane protein TolC [Leeuwenhoekiella marinoflava DSM 3653]